LRPFTPFLAPLKSSNYSAAFAFAATRREAIAANRRLFEHFLITKAGFCAALLRTITADLRAKQKAQSVKAQNKTGETAWAH
jgi:hypothetical protein